MEVIKQVIKSVINFLEILITEYTVLTILGLLIIIGLIAWCSITALNKAKKRAIQQQQEYKKSTIQSLTEEEINEISKNSANPEAAKEHLTHKAKGKTTKPVNTVSQPESINQEPPQPKAEVEPKKEPEFTYQAPVKTVPTLNISVKSKPIEVETAVAKSKPSVKNTKTETKPEVKANNSEVITVAKTTKPAVKTVEIKQTKPEPKKVEQPKTTIKNGVITTQPSKLEVKINKQQPKNVEEPAKKDSPIKKQTKKTEPIVEPVVEDKKRIYMGKWKIVKEDGGYYAALIASNGGTLLKTETYRSLSSVKSGIETIKRNIDGGNFAISVDKYGHYRFKLFNRTNRLICVSEDYSSKSKCESGIESVKRFAKTETIIFEDN